MSRHLPLLQGMFPGKLMLDVDEIASLTTYSKGHIYNLASAKKLPFKIADGLGDRLLVSIVEMADYLDSKLLTKAAENAAPEQEAEPPKRKVGRPRGTTKAALQVRCFQAELRSTIYQYEFKGILSELRQRSEAVEFSSNDALSCLDRLNSVKRSMLDKVGNAEVDFEAVLLEIHSRGA
ncbi:hypothetical protein [Curvibacter delicatus]|uniref:hypothetical protein n=1 Tax=Curvibacter delicatus TaxID=80879 RepID=UPI000AD16D17|nr:hypothetical protein [Curvibacter delicatus]